jgi:hypothetical protein
MLKNSDNYSLLINKLDEFIRKYYINQLIRGSLYTLAVILVFFLLISFAEYRFYFSSLVRKIFFYSFLSTSLASLWFLVIQPVLKINRLGEIISHQQAAQIIGQHFSDVQDKLLNILQLKELSASLSDAHLIQASINQKSLELKPVPFTSAVDLSENRKYLKFALPPLLLFLFVIFFRPSIIKESTGRLINNNVYFEKPMPFSFYIKNDTLKVVQYQDLKIHIELDGEEIPSEVYLVKNNLRTSTQKLNATNYAYVFTNVQDKTIFHLEAGGYRSKDFVIDVLAKPMITDFMIQITYPAYLGREQEVIKNTGDISVPFGSSVKWIFDAVATDKISMQFSDTLYTLNNTSKNQFSLNKLLKNSDNYIVKIENKTNNLIDSSQFNISVISDQYPSISVEEYQDSTNLDVYYYIGEISDDYGLSALTFNYRIDKAEAKKGFSSDKYETVNIPFQKGVISDFTYYWNIRQLNLSPGDRVDYYFEVWDNDGVNGRKSTRSKWMSYRMPGVDEFEAKSQQELDKIKEGLQESIDKSKELSQELKDLQQKMFQKKELSWEERKQIEDFIERQKNLQQNISEMENKLQQNIKQQSDFKKVSPEIQKKQEQLQKLFNDILDDETKALMERLEKMLENLTREDALEKLKEMELSDEHLEKELDRMLELLKKLEFDQKVQETIDKLDKLAQEQEKLSKESRDKNADSNELKDKQDKLTEQFDKLKEDLKNLQEMSNDLQEMPDFSDLLDKSDEVDQELNDAGKNLEKNNNQKASENQRKGAQKMQEMSKDLAKMKSSMDMQSMEEDMASLRRLLENLIKLSFSQEDLIYEFKQTSINTPKYLSLVQAQFKLIDDSKMVEDSLFALAKRVFQIESFITDEMASIKRNLSKTVELLEDRKSALAGVNQQYVMTGYNNLALMLSEVMEQMQQQMADQMDGEQMCQNPGNKPGKKPGKIPGLKQLQQQLNDQINQLSEMMKEGSSPGSKQGMSQKLAEIAAKQQQIRKALEEINKSDNKDGKGSLGNLQEIIDKMDKTETDLVNKQITQEMLKRQQEIMTRLLEAENAEKERDQKEERESQTAKQFTVPTPPSLEEYLRRREASLEMYKALPPDLRPYYRAISEKYFKNLTNID